MDHSELVAAVAGVLGGPDFAGLDADACYDKLHAQPELPGEGEAPQIPKVVSAGTLLNLIPPAELTAITTAFGLSAFLIEINKDSNAERLVYFDALKGLGHISEPTHAAVAAELSATVPDPDWAPVISYGPSPANLLFAEGAPLAGVEIPSSREAALDPSIPSQTVSGQVPRWLVVDALGSLGR